MADKTTPASTDRATRYRGEGRPKRRLSPSPPPPKTPARRPSAAKKATPKGKDAAASASKTNPTKEKPRSPSPEEESEDETLQSSFKPGQPFPTIRDPQAQDLPLRTYKSIAESGVLNSALEKSRQRWLVDGLFDKFWVKYSRKNKDEPAPSSQSMTKLNGDCFMVIEPHSFKITLFSVKAPPPSWTIGGPFGVGQAMARAPTTSTFSAGPPTPSLPSPFGVPIQSWAPSQTQQPSSAGAGSAESKPASTTPSTATQQPTPEPTKVAEPSPATQVNDSKVSEAPTTPATPTPVSTQANRQDTGNNTDPVIQMLAARAATDHELKTLMKIVAQGQASQDQLSIFQRHIDELNGIIQAQKRKTPQGVNGNTNSTSFQHYPSPSTPLPATSSVSFTTLTTGTRQQPYPMHNGGSQSVSIKQEPFSTYYHPNPAPIPKAKAPIPSKPVLSAIVFEFNEASGTRYLLPKNSILEYLPGNTQALMSFLITRKGDEATAGKYRAQKEYYQPVTVRLVADNPKLLEPLARVVSPPEEVRRHMADMMNRLELAEDVFLATRLPRPVDEVTPKAEESKLAVSVDEPAYRYDPPDSLLPLAASSN